VVPQERLHRATLQNGLRVLVLEDHRLPRAALGVVVRRGSADLPAAQAGLASYTTELMRRGAGARDALAFAQAVDALGATLSTKAHWDSMEVSISGLSGDLDALAALLAEVVLRPRFDPEEAVRLRSHRLADLERAKDDPATLAHWHLARALFPEHPYGLPQQGTPETVTGFDAAAARATHARFFVSGDAIFYAAGDVRREDALRRARELFGAWSGEPAPAVVGALPAPPPERRVVIVDRPELGQATIVLGHEGIRRTAPERVAVQLMNVALGGGGFSSRIMARVREEAGLAYYAYSGFAMRRAGGVFLAATGTRVPEAGRAVAMLLEELEAAKSHPPDAEEISHAKSLAVGRFALGLETSDALVSSLVDLDVFGLPEDSLDTYRTRMRQTGEAELQRVAREKLHPERVVITVVGPADALRRQLERFGPVEVVEP
jgi:zinc protease